MVDFLQRSEPYIIAEVGGNHGGDFEKAKEYVAKAAETGVDAVKFQLFRAECLIDRTVPLLPGAGTEHDTQYERYKELELEMAEWEEIVAECAKHGVDFAASVFDQNMANFVAERSPFVKIASGDLTYMQLLRHVSELGCPVVASTGFATWPEIDRAVAELPMDRTVLLHCVGSYPTAPRDANLQLINDLEDRFGVPVGYSDHTSGTLAAVGAAARGASVIEKHFTLDSSSDIGDHSLSASPSEMSEIVDRANTLSEMSSGGDRDEVFETERDRREGMRRSLAVREQTPEGTELTPEILTAIRPESGIPAVEFDDVVGQVTTRRLPARTILTWDDISENGN